MRNRHAKFILAAAAALVLSAAAAPAATVAPKGPYTVDPDHTQVVFAIRHMGLSDFYGRAGKVSGVLGFDQENPERSTLNVSIDVTTIDTHVPELDSTLPKAIFQADKFPTATFVSTSIAKTGTNTGTVTGNLTLAGVTKPVTLNVTFNGGVGSGNPLAGYRVGFDATTTIKRSDFGLTHVMWTGFVGDEVQLMIEAEAYRK